MDQEAFAVLFTACDVRDSGCLQNKIRLVWQSGWSRMMVTGILMVDWNADGKAGTPGATGKSQLHFRSQLLVCTGILLGGEMVKRPVLSGIQ